MLSRVLMLLLHPIYPSMCGSPDDLAFRSADCVFVRVMCDVLVCVYVCEICICITSLRKKKKLWLIA